MIWDFDVVFSILKKWQNDKKCWDKIDERNTCRLHYSIYFKGTAWIKYYLSKRVLFYDFLIIIIIIYY